MYKAIYILILHRDILKVILMMQFFEVLAFEFDTLVRYSSMVFSFLHMTHHLSLSAL